MVALKDINWLHVVLLGGTPLIALYGMLTVKLTLPTLIFSILYYFFTGLGITAGNHRYWAHRAYQASYPLEVILMLASSGAFEGSIRWWCQGHRAHHRYTDTEKDPYNAQKGIFYAHLGWMLVKNNGKKGRVDITDLEGGLVGWQHRNYLAVATFMAFVFPTLVAGLLWQDFAGGYFYAGVLRLVFVHHATFCVNSIAHFLGDTTFDDRHSPRDHFITALITLGEGYHNFHHEFPSDYRNAIEWWQYDPTKWVIWIAKVCGLASDLKTFPENEISKGKVVMIEKKVREIRERLDWGVPMESLPDMDFQAVQKEIEQTGKILLIISDTVHDVTQFAADHPGGRGFLKTSNGRDVTRAFNGGIYDHSNAARNLMAAFRVGRLVGSVPEEYLGKEE